MAREPLPVGLRETVAAGEALRGELRRAEGDEQKAVRLETATERPFPGQGNPQDPEVAQLKRENARLKEDNEILKKAVGIFTVRPQ